ncbi:ABC transporter ATP-binding protein [Frigidibacter albus]|uniref:Spermidine/putrescine import ATP-binding protein PotA n=1 Tax=Frigidibacter mobilis TaxID=1335048 RepID=A0A161GVV0_9RHOB|nr:ABC transporter ATP-binding protein [Frigidibacter mobilis]AMY67529.1 polyamine ABC transporter ATP-binding protein PotG [Frigidibacter mobilis]
MSETATAAVAVEARNVVKAFGQGNSAVRALDDVSLTIAKGEFFTLLGPSGCGKTTLLRLIAGFESPTSGAILLGGRDITALPPNRRPVNTVFQSYALFPHLTVAQNVAFGLQMLGKPKAEVAETVARMLALVKLEAFAGRRTSQLSGGQQQRVALARALAPAPQVLLLDEPLSALDLKLRKEMQTELKRLQTETGITFVFVTHDQEEALTMSDRIAVMSAGQILQIGTPRQIYTRPANRFVASFIGETNFLTARIAGGAAHLAGGTIALPAGTPDTASTTLAIRPEHLRIAPAGTPGALPATVAHSVYFGTDSHLHLRLADGAELVARQQTAADGAPGPEPGAAVAVAIAEGAVQVLQE